MILRPGMSFISSSTSSSRKSIFSMMLLDTRETHSMEGDPLTVWRILYVSYEGAVGISEENEKIIEYWVNSVRHRAMKRVL